MPTPYAGLQTHAVELLRKTVTAHAKVRAGIATHAEKHAALRQAERTRKHANAELSKPLKVPSGS